MDEIDVSHFCTVKQGQGRNRGKPQNWIFVSDSFTMQAAEKIIYNYPILPVEIKLITDKEDSIEKRITNSYISNVATQLMESNGLFRP